MKTGSEEASARVEEETQKMCAQKRPPVHSAGSKIRKTRTNTPLDKNLYSCSQNQHSFLSPPNTAWNEAMSTDHRVHRCGCQDSLCFSLAKHISLLFELPIMRAGCVPGSRITERTSSYMGW